MRKRECAVGAADGKLLDAAPARVEEWRAGNAEEQIEAERREAAPRTERCADEKDAEGLSGDRDGSPRDGDDHLRRCADDQRTDECQGEPLQTGTESLAEEDREEKVAERHAMFRRGDPRHRRDRSSDLHLSPPLLVRFYPSRVDSPGSLVKEAGRCGILRLGMVAIVQWLGPRFVEPQMRVQFPLATPPDLGGIPLDRRLARTRFL